MSVSKTRLTAELRTYARSLCRNNAEADQIIKETLKTALETSIQSPNRDRLRTMLFSMIRKRYYRTIVRRNDESFDLGQYSIGLNQGASGRCTQRSGIKRSIQHLPIRYREAIVLMLILDESHDDAAEIMECDVGTAVHRLCRARNMLKLQRRPVEA